MRRKALAVMVAFLIGTTIATAEEPGPPVAGQSQPSAKPIGWTNRLYDAYGVAAASGKPLVVLFTQDGCGWCVALKVAIDKEPRFKALQLTLVFVAVDPDRDEDVKGNVARLQKDLGIDRYPALVVLRASPDKLWEQGRIIGYFDISPFVSHLDEILRTAPSGGAFSLPSFLVKP